LGEIATYLAARMFPLPSINPAVDTTTDLIYLTHNGFMIPALLLKHWDELPNVDIPVTELALQQLKVG